MLIRPFRGVTPTIDPTAFIAETAVLVGDVAIGPEASVWYGAVIRGDIHRIRIGAGSNIQDNAVVHVDAADRAGEGGETVIGASVTVGHGAIVHACRIGDGCMIGMGAVILSGAVIGAGSVIAAGAVVREGMQVPPNSLVVGIPGVVKTTLPPERAAALVEHARRYAGLAAEFRRAG
ncbi:MAG TPA: gamma carbonic anhydrase family protein [Candidatus Ozemobacteraceae bacterium]